MEGIEVGINQGVEKPEIATKESRAILDMLELIREEGIELPPGIVARLKLLDSPRCTSGRCLKSGTHEFRGRDRDGNLIEKSTETHLEHSLELVKILKRWLPDFLGKAGESINPELKKMLVTTALLHDIGKTGPETVQGQPVDFEAQTAFISLFSIFESDTKKAGDLKNRKIKSAIREHIPNDPPGNKKNVRLAMERLGFNTSEQVMADIFGSHLKFSLDVLQTYVKRDGTKISPEIIFLVGNHHRFTHNYSYQLEPSLIDALPEDKSYRERLDQLATLVELADVFQALTARGQEKSAEEAFARMEKIYEKAPEQVQQMIKQLKLIEGQEIKK